MNTGPPSHKFSTHWLPGTAGVELIYVKVLCKSQLIGVGNTTHNRIPRGELLRWGPWQWILMRLPLFPIILSINIQHLSLGLAQAPEEV